MSAYILFPEPFNFPRQIRVQCDRNNYDGARLERHHEYHFQRPSRYCFNSEPSFLYAHFLARLLNADCGISRCQAADQLPAYRTRDVSVFRFIWIRWSYYNV